ncbi:hypothetical protein [Paenibacillus daejeonensis]|uniref:hypothetical protein n=1 Tax=Paenibacillus daejeonensis TaxID=135193 RepID=UPI0003684621|nr:hypothetical protein [Paenibacillus daejeonensis]
MKSQTRQNAESRLSQIHAQLYGLSQQQKALEDEARALAGYLNITQQEEREQVTAEQQPDETAKDVEQRKTEKTKLQ